MAKQYVEQEEDEESDDTEEETMEDVALRKAKKPFFKPKPRPEPEQKPEPKKSQSDAILQAAAKFTNKIYVADWASIQVGENIMAIPYDISNQPVGVLILGKKAQEKMAQILGNSEEEEE